MKPSLLAMVSPAVAPLITRSRARPRSPPSVAAQDGRVVAKREGHRVTDLPGTLADFTAAGTPEPGRSVPLAHDEPGIDRHRVFGDPEHFLGGSPCAPLAPWWLRVTGPTGLRWVSV